MNMDQSVVPGVITGFDKEGNVELSVAVSDYMKDREMPRKIVNAKKEASSIINEVQKLVPEGKPSRVPRINTWEAGKKIEEGIIEISNNYGVYITNVKDFVAKKLNVDPRTINFFVQFYNAIDKENVDERLSWTDYRKGFKHRDKESFLNYIRSIRS